MRGKVFILNDFIVSLRLLFMLTIFVKIYFVPYKMKKVVELKSSCFVFVFVFTMDFVIML